MSWSWAPYLTTGFEVTSDLRNSFPLLFFPWFCSVACHLATERVQPRSRDIRRRCVAVNAQYFRSPIHWRSGQDLYNEVTVLPVNGTIRGWDWLTGWDMMNLFSLERGFILRMEDIQESVRNGVPVKCEN